MIILSASTYPVASDEAIRLSVKVVYSDDKPAQNLIIIVCKHWVPDQGIIATNTTDENGVSWLTIPNQYKYVYIFVRIPYYDIIPDISPNYTLSRGLLLTLSGKNEYNVFIRLGDIEKAYASIRLINEYYEGILGNIILKYNDRVLAYSNTSYIEVSTINDTNIPLISSTTLRKLGYPGSYNIDVIVNENKFSYNVFLPINKTFIIDLNPPRIISHNLSIILKTIKTDLGTIRLVDINGTIIVSDGINSGSVNLKATLRLGKKTIDLSTEKHVGENMTRFNVNYKVKDLIIYELIKSNQIIPQIDIVLSDPGNHIVNHTYKPMIYSITENLIGNETRELIGNTTSSTSKIGEFNENTTHLVQGKSQIEQYPEVNIAPVVLSIAVFAFILELYRRYKLRSFSHV